MQPIKREPCPCCGYPVDWLTQEQRVRCATCKDQKRVTLTVRIIRLLIDLEKEYDRLTVLGRKRFKETGQMPEELCEADIYKEISEKVRSILFLELEEE